MGSPSLLEFRRGLRVALRHEENLPKMFGTKRERLLALARRDAVAVAHHEVGHVVAAYLVGARVAGATIIPRGVNVGANRVVFARSAAPLSLEQTTITLLGGLAAEAAFAGTPNWKGASHDLARALSSAEESLAVQPSKKRGAATEFLWNRWTAVSSLLRKPANRRAVKTVATLLVSKGKLSGRQIEDLLREHRLQKVHVQAMDAPRAVSAKHINRLNQGRTLEGVMTDGFRQRVLLGELPPAGTRDVGAFRVAWRTSSAGRVSVRVTTA
jgi:hypothetical protein